MRILQIVATVASSLTIVWNAFAAIDALKRDERVVITAGVNIIVAVLAIIALWSAA